MNPKHDPTADVTAKSSADEPVPAFRVRLPRESTTVNNPRKMNKLARRMLRQRASRL